MLWQRRAARVDEKHSLVFFQEGIVRVAEDDDVHGLTKDLLERLRNGPAERESGRDGAGKHLSDQARKRHLMDEAQRDTFELDDPLFRYPRIVLKIGPAMFHSDDWCNALQPVQARSRIDISGVQDEVYPSEGVGDLRWRLFARTRTMGIGNDADSHEGYTVPFSSRA